MGARIPEPERLISAEIRDGFHTLISSIRVAETDRELAHLTARFIEATREYRMLFTMVEEAQLRKLREFREIAESEAPQGIREAGTGT